MNPEIMLAAANLVKSYSGNAALRMVSISVQHGGVAVLLGPSGCGKSTLLRSISLLELPDAGVVQIDEDKYSFPRDLARSDISPWPRVTVVFQQHFLWPHMTLRQNIALPSAHIDGSEEHVAQLAEIFEVARLLDRFPNECSIGQRQRVALIRSLALRPRYILLDEITAALDVEQTGKILRYFLNSDACNAGLLVVTHLLGFARRLLATRQNAAVYFMDEGAIVEHGGMDILGRPATERFRAFLQAGETVA